MLKQWRAVESSHGRVGQRRSCQNAKQRHRAATQGPRRTWRSASGQLSSTSSCAQLHMGAKGTRGSYRQHSAAWTRQLLYRAAQARAGSVEEMPQASAPKVHSVRQARQLRCQWLGRQVGGGHAQLPAACRRGKEAEFRAVRDWAGWMMCVGCTAPRDEATDSLPCNGSCPACAAGHFGAAALPYASQQPPPNSCPLTPPKAAGHVACQPDGGCRVGIAIWHLRREGKGGTTTA